MSCSLRVRGEVDALSSRVFTLIVPCTEEEKSDGHFLSGVTNPAQVHGATDDDTVWVIALGEFVNSDSY